MPERTLNTTAPNWAQDEVLASLRKHKGTVDQLALFSHYIDPKGKITAYEDGGKEQEIIAEMRKQSGKVTMLVTNSPEEAGVWDPKRVRVVSETADARQKFAKALLAHCNRYKADGIYLDFENLDDNQRADFSKLVATIAETLHKAEKTLDVALHEKTSDRDPNGSPGSGAQDWKELGKHADRLHLMLAGWAGPGWSPPGASSPIPAVRKVLDYAVKEIPRDKIVGQFPCGAEGWLETGKKKYEEIPGDVTSGGFPLTEVEKLRKKHDAKWVFDKKSQTPYFTYVDEGKKHHVWGESEKSLRAKGRELEKRNIPHMSWWPSGGETPGAISAFKAFREGKLAPKKRRKKMLLPILNGLLAISNAMSLSAQYGEQAVQGISRYGKSFLQTIMQLLSW